MSIATFITKNALRNKRRAALSILSVAVSLFLFVTLLVALREITVPPSDIGASLRIAVRNKVSFATPLPARQRPILERIPGVAAVTPLTWFAGRFRDEEFTMFAQFAVDPASLTNIFSDIKLAPEQLRAWQAERTACVVGKDTMERYRLKLGDRLKFGGTIWPCDLDLKIVGTFEGSFDDRSVFFNQKYLDEALGGSSVVSAWWLRATSVEEASLVPVRINQAFANTAAEVRAETERAFQLSFVSMWGNIKLFMGSICTVVVFTLLLVTVSTMSMAIRERFRELALLKAFGFRRRELFAFILAESFALALVGAILGAGGAWLFYHVVNIEKLSRGILVYFEVTPKIMGLAFLVSSGLGIVASIFPSLAVARTNVVDGLKTLD
ncbi:MAG: FtsX-like permease family protein [Verrucomicrobia bacterium]|nr:FtsX-like permease family protein [Verrucomicrobiota bacterium]